MRREWLLALKRKSTRRFAWVLLLLVTGDQVEELKATLKTLDEGKGMDYDEIGQDPRR